MKKSKLVYLIIFLAAYLPFEDFTLKWFHVSEDAFIILRQMPDAIVYSFILFMVLTYLMSRKVAIVDKSLPIYLVVFISIACLSILINNSSLANSALKMNALLRYMLLVFILYWLRPTEKQATLFIKTVIVISLVEATVGILQYYSASNVRSFFQPRELTAVQYAVTAIKKGSGESFGTMANTINYAFFLVIGLVVLITLNKHAFNYKVATMIFIVFYLMLGIYASGSRSAFLSVLIIIGLYIYYKYNIRILLYFMPLLLGLVFMIMFADVGTSAQDFWFFLSPGYLDMLESQRLGMIRILVDYIGAMDPHLLFGLSPDKSHLVQYLSMHYKMPLFFSELTLQAFEDVYWAALLFYYGAVGLFIYVLMIFSIYKKVVGNGRHNNLSAFHIDLILTTKIMLVMLIPVNMFGQILVVRQYAFYMWMMVGIALSFKNVSYSQQANHTDN